jgi:hypothetical protein
VLAPWRIAFYMPEFASGKTERFSREETDQIVREVKAGKQTSRIPTFLYVHNINLLHRNPFIYNNNNNTFILYSAFQKTQSRFTIKYKSVRVPGVKAVGKSCVGTGEIMDGKRL